MGNRFHNERYKNCHYSPKYTHGQPSKSVQRVWRRRERTWLKDELNQFRHDWDRASFTHPKYAHNWWDWY